jgi:hypothetical protein
MAKKKKQTKKSNFYYPLILLLIALALLLLLFCLKKVYFKKDIAKQTAENQVCFENDCFLVELAKTDQARQRGLMFRKELGEKEGMLFLYDTPGVYYFWMKNTLIPLDIIFLDENKRVIYVSKNTPPCKTANCPSYGTDQKSLNILELKGGKADKYGIKVGDQGEIIMQE